LEGLKPFKRRIKKELYISGKKLRIILRCWVGFGQKSLWFAKRGHNLVSVIYPIRC